MHAVDEHLPAPRLAAQWYNNLQALAESTRLGIPVTISSDPRHAFSNNPATSFFAGAFSQWPEPIGLAAAGDTALVEQFGDIARQEYLALGIRGDTQHAYGMKHARYTVAVHPEPDAPILKQVDAALIGDPATVAKELTELLK